MYIYNTYKFMFICLILATENMLHVSDKITEMV